MDDKIELSNVYKWYGKKLALNNINLIIGKGMFGLLGRNGAGKTTLMKVIATLLQVNNGEITVCGIPVKNAGEIRSIIGYLPQDFTMYGNMTVYEAMDYLGVLSGLDKKARKERIPFVLQQVNLNDDLHTKVKAMSGGMKRRLGIAQAILHEPKVLIVDEPTAGLDPEERVRFRNLLCEMAEERIVILSTHIVGDIESTCENIAVMDNGSIIYTGLVAKLIEMAEGKIYSARISKLQFEELKKQYTVIEMVTKGNYVDVRFVVDGRDGQDEQDEQAILCNPSVEDAYMYLIHQRGGIR